jgi:hypothetical protein
MFGSHCRWFDGLKWVSTLLVFLVPSPAWGQDFFGIRPVGGIVVDPDGAVRLPTTREREELLAQLRTQPNPLSPELEQPTELRRISLRALEAALSDIQTGSQDRVPPELAYMAGLQRVRYVLVYPEQNDIVLAGPGEGWRFDKSGNAIGTTTGLPVVRLDDLLVAFQTVDRARTEGISVSIDPTPEGRQRFEAFIQQQKRFSPAILNPAARALGPQQVTFTGVPTDSHFARILFAADYRMKRLAMNLEKAPVAGLPGYLDMLKSRNRLPGSAVPRWWMACNYEPLGRSGDRLAWEIRGQGVKAMSEDELVAADGTIQGTGQADPIAKDWADLLTKRFADLAVKDPVFGQLRNIMDLCVVAALIKHESLFELAGAKDFPRLTRSDSGLVVGQLPTPKTVEPQCSFLKIGRSYVITASGGVQIDSWDVARKNALAPQVGSVHVQGAPPLGRTRWWN